MGEKRSAFLKPDGGKKMNLMKVQSHCGHQLPYKRFQWVGPTPAGKTNPNPRMEKNLKGILLFMGRGF